jgi:deoxyribodipyrimidine photolyase-related protein
MRHFAAELRSRGWSLTYIELDAPDNSGTLTGELDKAILQCKPQQLVMTAPGEWRVL